MAQTDKIKKIDLKVEKNEKITINPRYSLYSAKYFTIDVTNLRRYTKNAPNLGKEYKAATVALDHDMGVFVEARIREYNDGRLTVEFWGDRAVLTPQIVRFIADCVTAFGPTLTGDTEVTQEDYDLVKQFRFNRMWNQACVTMSNNDDNVPVMVLALFNPPQQTDNKKIIIDK